MAQQVRHMIKSIFYFYPKAKKFTVKQMLLTNYVLSYFALRHSVIPLQNNIPEAGVRIRPEDWKLDQDLAFYIVKFKVQSIKNKHTRPQWCLKCTKEKKSYWKREEKYWPELGFWDGLTKGKEK